MNVTVRDLLRLKGIAADKVFTGPRTVNIHLTNACNLSCRYCSFHNKSKKDDAGRNRLTEISLPVFKKFVDDCALLRVEEIALSGEGDPLMHSAIVDMIDYVRSKGIILSVNTNLSSSQQKVILALNKASNINVHLSAVTRKSYASLQSKNGNVYDQVMRNWRFLLKARGNNLRPFFHLVFILNRNNYAQLEDAVDLAYALKARSVKFRIARVCAETKQFSISKEVLPDFRRIVMKATRSKKFFRVATNIKQIYRLFFSTEFRETSRDVNFKGGYSRSFDYDRIFEPGFKCYYGWYFAFVDLQGAVFLCCQNRQFPVGNILVDSFKKIWLGRAAMAARLAFRDEFDIRKKIWTECHLCTNADSSRDIAKMMACGLSV